MTDDQFYNDYNDAIVSMFYKTNALLALWARKHRISLNALMFYEVLNSRKVCNSQQICEETLLPKQSISSIIKEQDKLGYLCIASNPQDKRSKIISLSEAGLNYSKNLLSGLKDIEVKALKKLNREDVIQLLQSEEIFYMALQAEIQTENTTHAR